MKTRAVFFPFDLFGSNGSKAGAELLADAFQEMLADNRRERVPTRARAYRSKVQCSEHLFETLSDYQDWREVGRSLARDALAKGDFLLWTSGNHLGTLPILDELSTRDNDILIIQFDAHLDVYNLSDCTDKLSHGNFLLHCDGPLPPIVHVGHRELLLRPDYYEKYFREVISAADLALRPEEALRRLRELGANVKRIAIDLDCDVFDPAYFPASAQAQPIGLSPHLFLRCLEAIGFERLTGMFISEFDPLRDENDRSLGTLMWLIEYVLLRLYEKG